MIPRLIPEQREDALVAKFLAALRKTGFRGEICLDEASRTVFSTDNSIYELAPQAVLFPRSGEDISTALKLLAADGFASLKIAARGGGTGTNGQSLTDGIVLDLSRYMNEILEINQDEGWVRVQAGVVKDQLNAALSKLGMFFAPELSTSNRATIGGMINTDASGQGSCLYGKTRDHVIELTSVLTDGSVWTSHALDDLQLVAAKRQPGMIGEIHRSIDRLQCDNAVAIENGFPKLNRCLTGYDLAHIRDAEGRFNLNSVLCGSEGTLAVVSEAKLRVLPIPAHSALVNLRYETFNAGLRDARSLMAFGAASIETVDSKVLALAQGDIVWDGVKEFFPAQDGQPARGINLIEFVGATEDDIDGPLRRLVDLLGEESQQKGRLGYTIARGEVAVQRIWQMRKRAVGLLGNMQGDKRPIPFVEDTAVPPENLADYIEEFRALLDARGLDYGMFGHVDAGVLHVRPAIDMKDPEQKTLIRAITDEVADLTLKYGGLLWGEHGKGVRSEYAPKFFGELYPIIQAVKHSFDPRYQLNPGKIAGVKKQPLLKIDEVPTRGQADRKIPRVVRDTYADAMHCNGNGACYDWDPDTAMCPSWKAVRERKHSPKGRAMLTKEWLRRLAIQGVDPVAQAFKIRSRSRFVSFPGKLLNTVRHRHADDDFSHQVKNAMDGCLACKSCVGGCPIKVNVPSFRAKFLELYYGRYLRPAKDILVGRLERLLPLMARFPSLTNGLLGSPAIKSAVRMMGLVDLPSMSAVDLKKELTSRGLAFASPAALSSLSREEKQRAVVVVQDAFTSFYEGELVLATLELLAGLGFIPFLSIYHPNGKPQHVHGYLKAFEDTARAQVWRLRELSNFGIPLVGIDPSMTLTYRSEYAEALGTEGLPKVLLLQEWLANSVSKTLPVSGKHFRLLPHCTERATALGSLQDWTTVFTRLGLTLNVVAAGCCGMAGTYGHETKNLSTSKAIFDLSWKRIVNEGQGFEELLATGYSCRSQVKRFGGQRLRHPVEALLENLSASFSRDAAPTELQTA